MKHKIKTIAICLMILVSSKALALSSGDVSVRLISGYFWLDNSCTTGSPLGKVVSFRIKNTKGALLQGVTINLGSLGFTATGAASYTSGTPSFVCRTSTNLYLGNIAAGDSVTAFFYVGYNCLMYPNNTNITTDYLTLPITLSDVNSGTVSLSFTKSIYVIRNSNNNTITVLATTQNLVGTMLTISVAYNISNVKPTNIIDMELSTTSTFPSGYSILGCKITASSITADFPVGLANTHYYNSISSNLPSGGTVTIEWYLKITGASTGITSSNLIPFVVSDAGSSQRWQANTTSFTGTSTPTNSISIKKKVNLNSVLTSDTVVYTIVIKNSSNVASVSIDRLVDNLPRDYQFRYIQTDTNVFKRLVTYANSTVYPVFQDTNLLFFNGQKEISTGVFSWVVPKNDSIELIYSARVSSSPGTKDTNTIHAYVGSSSVGNSFAVVNVYSPLPIKFLYFNSLMQTNDIALSWGVVNDGSLKTFKVYRRFTNEGVYEKIAEFNNLEDNTQTHFKFIDQDVLSNNPQTVLYKLEQISNEGITESYFTDIDINKFVKGFTVLNFHQDGIGISGVLESVKLVKVTIADALGRQLYVATLQREGSLFLVPWSPERIGSGCVLITLESNGVRTTQKLIFEN